MLKHAMTLEELKDFKGYRIPCTNGMTDNTKLLDFINTKMRMTAIYQPVIIACLLRGQNSLTEIAEEISLLLEGTKANSCYYLPKLKIHPNKVLKSHGIAHIVPRSGEFTFLIDIEGQDTEGCLSACVNKINQFLAK